MSIIKKILFRFTVVGELFSFLWRERIWWMIPMVIVLVLLGILIIMAQGASVAPFIYTIF